jgi:hypothetical protein
MTRKLLLVCPLLLVTSAAWALPVCTSTTLNVYTNNDADNYSCTLGGLTFSNFAYKAGSGLPTELSVNVLPTTSTAGDVGFIFDGAFSAGAGTSADAILSYQISAASPMITGSSLSLLSAGAAGTGASAAIAEGICTTMPTGAGACLPSSNAYSIIAYINAGQASNAGEFASVNFATAASTVFVTKNIVEMGGAGNATISSFENTVQTGGGGGNSGGGPVPEPASFFTMGSGLIAAAVLMRNKLKRG